MTTETETTHAEPPLTADQERQYLLVGPASDVRRQIERSYALVMGAAAALKDGQLYTAHELLAMAEELLEDRLPLRMLEARLGIDTRPKDEVELPQLEH